MQGVIILCTEHHQVHNASTRQWQDVPQEICEELLAMAQEVGDVVIYQGCCPMCSEAVSQSFTTLYHHRYTKAMTREMGYDIHPHGTEDD